MAVNLDHKPFSADIVILLSVDSLRADRLNQETMPRVQELVGRSGYSFRQAYTNIPYTGAAHATMLTSLYACNHGKTDNSWILASQIQSVAQVLRDHGVKTGAIVSAAPMRKEQSGFDRGFSIYIQDEREKDRLQWLWVRLNTRAVRLGLPDFFPVKPFLSASNVLTRAFEIIQENQRARRKLFLFIHLMDVHEPYSLLQLNQPGVPLLESARTLRKMYKRDALNEHEVKIFTQVYDANVRMLDQVLGSFLHVVLADNVAVLVTSDHGENAFEKKARDSHTPYPGKNRSLYQPEVGVPLALLGREIEDSAVVDNVVSHLDLAPTILVFFDVHVPPQFQGLPLWERDRDSAVFMERLDWLKRNEAAWLRWPWKLMTFPGPEKEGFGEAEPLIELYNLETDPHETTNLYDREEQVGRKLLQELLNFTSKQTDFYRETHREPSSVGEDDGLIAERLRMLGYIE